MALSIGLRFSSIVRLPRNIQQTRLWVHTTPAVRVYLKKDGDEDYEDLDNPIKFTTSEAAKWSAAKTFGGEQTIRPKYHGWIILGSLAAFLLHWCVLREENDMDEELGKTLWERIPGLEQQQLRIVLQYNKDNGLPYDDVAIRLKDVIARDEALEEAAKLKEEEHRKRAEERVIKIAKNKATNKL